MSVAPALAIADHLAMPLIQLTADDCAFTGQVLARVLTRRWYWRRFATIFDQRRKISMRVKIMQHFGLAMPFKQAGYHGTVAPKKLIRNTRKHLRISRKNLFAVALFLCSIASSHAQSNSNTVNESPADAWFTGPLIAVNAAALPQNSLLVEPYLLWNHHNGIYNNHGNRHAGQSLNDNWSLDLPIYYGITDRLTGVVLLSGEHAYDVQGSSNGFRFGDLGLRLAYEVLAGDPQAHIPTVALTVMQNIPTGRYDRLGTNLENGVGTGLSSTQLAVNTQTYFWMPNGHILRIRANLAWTFPNGRSDLVGNSIYATTASFRGHISSGQSQQLDIGAEYSINRHWALATDLLYAHNGNTLIYGSYPDSAGLLNTYSGTSMSLDFAPAVEYHWNERLGLIGGVQFTMDGRNTASEVTPQIALNMVF